MLTKNCYTELNQPNLEKILSVIRNGGIFIYPTETVWALGCIALNKSSVDKIYQLKKREKSKPLICLIDNFERISKYAVSPESKIATKLKLHNHPTVIYQKAKPNLKHVASENNEIAIRITPINELKKIIKMLNAPIISTSANISGQPFPVNFNDIDKNISSAVDLMLNFEVESTGIPSTIIRIDETGELQYLR